MIKKKKKKKNPWNYVHISQYTRSHWPTFSASAKYSADRRKHQVLTASEQTIRYDDKTQTVHAGSFKYASWKSHWRPITTQVKDWTAKKYVSVALYMGPSVFSQTHALIRHVRPARQESAFPLQQIYSLKAEMGRTKHKLFLPTSEHTFLNFLLLTFSEQAS